MGTIESTDAGTIAAQLGRAPRGGVTVAVRCDQGAPLVIRTTPALADGRPFPTLFWLTCPSRAKAIARLEADGLIGRLQDRVRDERDLAAELGAAAERYSLGRGLSEAYGDRPRFIGGAADVHAVKCLHAHYAHYLATGHNPIGRIVASLLGRMQPESERLCENCRL